MMAQQLAIRFMSQDKSVRQSTWTVPIRDWSGNYLAARLSDLQFYNTAMSASGVFEMFNQWGRFLGRFYKDTLKYLSSGSTEIINTGISSTMEGTIMVDVCSQLNDNVSYYRAIVDSWNYISGHYMEFQYASGMPSLGIDNGKYVVMLQSAGRWDTGVACPLNTWHNVALVYTQNSASSLSMVHWLLPKQLGNLIRLVLFIVLEAVYGRE